MPLALPEDPEQVGVMQAGWVLGPRVGESHRTSQEGPWLVTGWKSNASQEEVRVEFVEDMERIDMDREFSGRLRKERRLTLIFAWGLRFLLRCGARILSVIRELKTL